MSKTVVSDSSCLIGLSKIGRLETLREVFGKIIIPPAVYNEVVISGKDRAGAEEVKNADWIKNETVKNKLAVLSLRIDLGVGESEAIILAYEFNADFIILDDRKARQAAEELGLPVIGTAAVLQKAEEKGIIVNCQSAIDELRNVGFRLLFQLIIVKGYSSMKVKMFTNVGDAPALETEINDWLDNNNKIAIKHIKQDYAYDNKGDMFYSPVSIWYEDSKRH